MSYSHQTGNLYGDSYVFGDVFSTVAGLPVRAQQNAIRAGQGLFVSQTITDLREVVTVIDRFISYRYIWWPSEVTPGKRALLTSWKKRKATLVPTVKDSRELEGHSTSQAEYKTEVLDNWAEILEPYYTDYADVGFQQEVKLTAAFSGSDAQEVTVIGINFSEEDVSVTSQVVGSEIKLIFTVGEESPPDMDAEPIAKYRIVPNYSIPEDMLYTYVRLATLEVEFEVSGAKDSSSSLFSAPTRNKHSFLVYLAMFG